MGYSISYTSRKAFRFMSFSYECKMTFWTLISYSDFPNDQTFHPFNDLDIELDFHRITTVLMDHLQRVLHASRKRLPFRTPGPVPLLGTAYAQIVETSFPKLTVSFLDFSSWKKKRKRSDSVLWQKPLHQQKCQKGKVTTQTTPQKSSIKQRLRTDLGRSVGVTTATQLVWLTGLRAHLPTNRNSRLIKRTHI